MKSPSEATRLPVIYVHAKGRAKARPDEIEALLGLGCAVCSRLGEEGSFRTDHGLDQPGALLRELTERFPGQPVAIIRAGLKPSPEHLAQLTALLESAEEPLVLTMLSNANAALNPFAGLTAPAGEVSFGPADLVSLLAPGYLHSLTHWTDHFLIFSSGTAELMAAAKAGSPLVSRLESVAGRLAVPDFLYLHDPGIDTYQQNELQPHESLYPPPFGDLSARLQAWLASGIDQLPDPVSGGPATLHITHSWGGGIARWIDTFIGADREHAHFQLRSEGPQSDRGCGQRLSLYVGTELRCAVASWWLQPPIRSVEDSLGEYREIIDHICRRYGIGRVVVSSLIGHSLDALRTGLPTMQVLHDHFPLWPLLSVNPWPYLRDNQGVDIDAALSEHAGEQEFEDKDAAAWSVIRKAYIRALKDYRVTIVAPGQSVLDLQARLEPAFEADEAHVIPHGSSIPVTEEAIEPRPRPDGRLRMVVLGRIQAGKGQRLLLDSLNELSELVQVYLLGSGKSGEKFFGSSGVDVIFEYEQEELPAMLRAIGPHFAALLSIVPETFSFTLSELQQLGIPAIATRLGSFPDRIVHGQTGWLIEADPQALIEQVTELCRSPDEINRVRTTLSRVDVPATEQMLASYNRIFPLPAGRLSSVPAEPGLQQSQIAAAKYQGLLSGKKLQVQADQQEALRRELDARTEWVLDVKRQLKAEQQARIRVEDALTATRSSLAELKHQHQQLEAQNVRLAAQNSSLEKQIAAVLSSRTWRVTRPFRIIHRLAKNFMLARVWNPARWPALVSALRQNISDYGLKGALARMQDVEAVEPESEHDTAIRVYEEPESQRGKESEKAAEPGPPGSFPRSEHPDVSIVIPVFNNWPYTAACLRSLADKAGKHSFEVIVVDDGSEDQTRQSLEAIDGLEYIRNERNLGFVGSCNRGARRARGEYLVILNNDTEVSHGWLEPLIDTLKHEPGAGLVGARLVYPDGRLQESGGIIFSDGSGWNYGREDTADLPEYSFMREVDYCSGACIALKKELFDRLGGFDELFSPAYYEDTDLAFRVREAGLKVLVQPASTVIHHEGATSGTDTSAGMKKYQLINQEKFVKRWREQLRLQPGAVMDKSDRNALRAATEHRCKGRILFIATTPTGGEKDRDGDHPYRLMKCCSELGYRVSWLVHGGSADADDANGLQQAGIEVMHAPWLTSAPDFFANRGAGFDYVFVRHHEVAVDYLSLLNEHCPGSHLILDETDRSFPLESTSTDPEPDFAQQRKARWARQLALSVVNVADATLVGCQADLDKLAKVAPEESVHVLAGVGQQSAGGEKSTDCTPLAKLFSRLSRGD